jgi:cell division protein DivIC
MRFVEIINKKKFTLISIFLFIYVSINLFDGDRGLISYYEKQKKIDLLIKEKEKFTEHLNEVEKKNSLLTETIDTDYLEILYRKMFVVGKANEKIYIE